MIALSDKDRLRSHLYSLELYNTWERDHPAAFSPTFAIASIGYLYQLLPLEERKRTFDVNEITHRRKIFSKLKDQNDRP